MWNSDNIKRFWGTLYDDNSKWIQCENQEFLPGKTKEMNQNDPIFLFNTPQQQT